jgi:hypothetical protein
MKSKRLFSRSKSGSYLLEVEVDHLAQGTVASVSLDRLKTLVSDPLLPVCACCQRLRDARGEWRQFELPPLDSGTWSISPTICPTCASKLR